MGNEAGNKSNPRPHARCCLRNISVTNNARIAVCLNAQLRCVYAHVHVYVYVYAYVYAHVHVYVCMYVCMRMRMCICMFICMCLYV